MQELKANVLSSEYEQKQSGWAKIQIDPSSCGAVTSNGVNQVISLGDFAKSENFAITDHNTPIASTVYSLPNLMDATEGGFYRGRVYSFFGALGSGTTDFITQLAYHQCTTMQFLADMGEIGQSVVGVDKQGNEIVEWEGKGYEPSYLFYDKNRLTQQFMQDLFAHAVRSNPNYKELCESYAYLNHKTWNEKHQLDWYISHIKHDIVSLPDKTGANLDIIFYNGVQDPDLFAALKQIAYMFGCTIITTSTLPSKVKTIPEDCLEHCDFAGLLKPEEGDGLVLEDFKGREVFSTHRLYITKNTFLNNEHYLGRIKVPIGNNGKKGFKSNYLMFDMSHNRLKSQGTLASAVYGGSREFEIDNNIF
jgi:RecA/RadA recombinase